MEEVKSSLLELKRCISSKKADKKISAYTQAIGHVESHLLLLKSPTLTEQLANKLCLCLPLSKLLYGEKILPEFTAGRHDQKARYESILTSLLSGILDFLDEDNDSQGER
ncbi:hypothetical protein QCA50_002655 [Cerrena zonata]|uniref:Uncharacterized protein n=1 Tax=Cerrena zonata TaxID=2478898 RepID=A0AAW0GIG9_9APHY